jgi:hypothetical protein
MSKRVFVVFDPSHKLFCVAETESAAREVVFEECRKKCKHKLHGTYTSGRFYWKEDRVLMRVFSELGPEIAVWSYASLPLVHLMEGRLSKM